MSPRKTILITGSTSGLGRAAATKLAAAGHRVILHGRDPTKLAAAVAEVGQAGGTVESVAADLGSLASVRGTAAEVAERFGDLDVLINNAAISNWSTPTRQETVDGHERLFATNYLSHYLLTRLLLPRLLTRPAPRIVNVGARQMAASFDWADLEMTRSYDPMQAVLRAKLGMFFLTRAIARQYQGHSLRVSALDPGLVDTGYQQGASWPLRLALKVVGKRPADLVDLYAWLAIDGDVSTDGRLYSAPGKPAKWRPYVADGSNLDRIWQASAELVGL